MRSCAAAAVAAPIRPQTKFILLPVVNLSCCRPVVDAGTSSPSSATSGDQASAEAPGTALCRPDSRLNDRDANDAAASPSQVPVQLEASEPSGPSSSAALSSVNCAGAPAKSGDFDLKEKVRIVTLIGGLDAKRQGEMYGIIQKYQPMLLAASDDVVEIQVNLLNLRGSPPFLIVYLARH